MAPVLKWSSHTTKTPGGDYMNYHYLSIEGRSCIRKYYVEGLSYRKFDRLVGRNVSAISREIRRNCTHMYDSPFHFPRSREHYFTVNLAQDRSGVNLTFSHISEKSPVRPVNPHGIVGCCPKSSPVGETLHWKADGLYAGTMAGRTPEGITKEPYSAQSLYGSHS